MVHRLFCASNYLQCSILSFFSLIIAVLGSVFPHFLFVSLLSNCCVLTSTWGENQRKDVLIQYYNFAKVWRKLFHVLMYIFQFWCALLSKFICCLFIFLVCKAECTRQFPSFGCLRLRIFFGQLPSFCCLWLGRFLPSFGCLRLRWFLPSFGFLWLRIRSYIYASYVCFVTQGYSLVGLW